MRRIRFSLPLLLAAAVIGAPLYLYETWMARPAMVFQGVPEATGTRPVTWTRIFRNEGFLLGYSDLRGNPLWVSYRLMPIPEKAPRFRRPRQFVADWRTLTRIDHDTYTGSGYDRGHLAPNYAISRLYGRAAQMATFLMSNISPQRPKLNRELWERLEEVEIDHFAGRFGEVWVTTGPVFDDKVERLEWRVEVPDAFYKIYAAPGAGPDGAPRLLAFLIPQTVQGNEPLDRFVTSVDAIESGTGLDFFHRLEDDLENRLEAAIDPAPWGLAEVANLPGRYSSRNKR